MGACAIGWKAGTMTDQEKIESTLRDLGRRIAADGSIADAVMRRIEETPGLSVGQARGAFRRRILTMNRIAKYAAGIVIVTGVLALLVWQGVGSGGATIAWADVQARVKQAGSWVFTMTVDQGEQAPMVSTMFFDGESRTREEMKDMVSLIDWDTGSILVLALTEKVSYQGMLENMGQSPMTEAPQNWIEGLRQVASSPDATALEDREIDGVKAKGWEVRRKGTDEIVTVWADARSAQLVRVEFLTGGIRTVLSEFEHDRVLDASLFVQEPPEGYRALNLGPTFDAPGAGLDDLVCLLRVWGGGNGGVFPDHLFDMPSWYKATERYDWSRETLSVNELQKAFGQGFAFLGMNRGNWEYTGKGVKVGQKDTPIFRYKPAGETAWQVIYADLHIESVPTEEPE
jgi:outer membrane lipoprotein-sorting protein